MSKPVPNCAKCPFKVVDRKCFNPKDGKGPENCPTLNWTEICQDSVTKTKDDLEFAKSAALVEIEGYEKKDGQVKSVNPRIVEIISFAKKQNYKKLGLIFCMGLRNEAIVTAKILENHGFEVVSVVCKVGGVSKQELEVSAKDSMCNPIMQAEIANAAKVDFNILLGLCVGHDSMAIKYLEAPVTVFAVKDRVLGNNPLAAIYTSETYYRHILKP